MQDIKWLSEILDEDVELVGKDCYDLSRLYKAKYPVANGFCISKNAWKRNLANNGAKHKIDNLLSQANITSKEALSLIANEVRSVINNIDVEASLRKEINDAYSNMNISTELHGLMNSGAISLIKAGRENSYVVVSSSISHGLVNGASVYSLKGIDSIMTGIRKCLADSVNGDVIEMTLRNQLKE